MLLLLQDVFNKPCPVGKNKHIALIDSENVLSLFPDKMPEKWVNFWEVKFFVHNHLKKLTREENHTLGNNHQVWKAAYQDALEDDKPLYAVINIANQSSTLFNY